MSKGKQPRTSINKVPKLLLSEIKGVVTKRRPGNRLRSGHFLKIS